MNQFFLTRYSVKGIKALDELITLSFYKKTISKDVDTRDYNIKGIYGMNGSGKSAIIDSVNILRNVLNSPDYLNNPIVQKNLDASINKKNNELFIEVEFLEKIRSYPLLYRYCITLSKDLSGKFVIAHERLSYKKATSKGEDFTLAYEVKEGEIEFLYEESPKEKIEQIKNVTKNLLLTTPFSLLVLEKLIMKEKNSDLDMLDCAILALNIFVNSLHVYLEQQDDHQVYIQKNFLRNYMLNGELEKGMNELTRHLGRLDLDHLFTIDIINNAISKQNYEEFSREVNKLYEFLHIFKPQLKKIEIDKKEDREWLNCDLIMVYDDYKIHGEYESTGIKKLVKLYAYFKEAVNGGIVFIDELDANLHDVYLCALLEYFMEYGDGQLCFTTHNVGPMDILKQHKKSIDFLSENHQIYSWKKNGNYSPSKLYRNGMIEGSPFNVDSIDFIGVFSSETEDE